MVSRVTTLLLSAIAVKVEKSEVVLNCNSCKVSEQLSSTDAPKSNIALPTQAVPIAGTIKVSG